METMELQRPFIISVIVRVVRYRSGCRLEVIDLHCGERTALRSWDDVRRLLRRLAPGLR
jgi:hypothetical protein